MTAGTTLDTQALDLGVARLAAATRLSEVQEAVRSSARRCVGADGATFVLREGDRCFYADEDAMSPLWKGQRFPLTECISGWAMLNDEVAVVPDITQDARIPLEAYRPTFVESLAMVPIGAGDPVGAIGAYWARRHEATPDQLALLVTLAEAAADALARVGLDDAPFTPTDLRGSSAAAGT